MSPRRRPLAAAARPRRSTWLLAGLVILAMGCSGAGGSGGVGPGLVGTAWRLVSIDGAAPPAGPDVTIRFEADRVSGEAPCNSYSGFYSQDARRGTLVFGSMVSTKRACVDPARSRLETTWFGALSGQVTAGLDGDSRLELTAGGVELSLDRIR